MAGSCGSRSAEPGGRRDRIPRIGHVAVRARIERVAASRRGRGASGRCDLGATGVRPARRTVKALRTSDNHGRRGHVIGSVHGFRQRRTKERVDDMTGHQRCVWLAPIAAGAVLATCAAPAGAAPSVLTTAGTLSDLSSAASATDGAQAQLNVVAPGNGKTCCSSSSRGWSGIGVPQSRRQDHLQALIKPLNPLSPTASEETRRVE